MAVQRAFDYDAAFGREEKLRRLRTLLEASTHPALVELRDGGALRFEILPEFGADLAYAQPSGFGRWTIAIRRWVVDAYDLPVLVAEIVHEVGAHVFPESRPPHETGADVPVGHASTTDEQADHLRMAHNPQQQALARQLAGDLLAGGQQQEAREMLVAYLLDLSTIDARGDRIKAPLRPGAIAATYRRLRDQMPWMDAFVVPYVTATEVVGRYAALYWKALSGAVSSWIASWRVHPHQP